MLLAVSSPQVRQAKLRALTRWHLELGLIDEIDLHIAPILLGESIRLYDNPGSEPIRLHRVGEGDPPRPSTHVPAHRCGDHPAESAR
jgi:hypothetical protein